MLYEATPFECSRIAQDLQIRKAQVESVVGLLNEGNTIPFIACFRKDRTNGLDEDAIRNVQTRLQFLKQLGERKDTILKSIETQDKLSNELRHEIQNAPSMRRLEDLYMPFKSRKKALAHAARDKGLEPLAFSIWHSDPAVGNLEELWPSLVNPEQQLASVDDVKAGVQHLIAEMIHETAEVRAVVRRWLWKHSALASQKSEKAREGAGSEFKPYFQFKESTQDIRPHRVLALNRGEREGILKVKLEWDTAALGQAALEALAERLAKDAGKPAPAPSAPPKPTNPEPALPAPGSPPAPAPVPPTAPPLGIPPAPAPVAPPSPATPPAEAPAPDRPPELPAMPPLEAPPGVLPGAPIETPAEVPVVAPPAEMPASTPGLPGLPPHAAPLVASLSVDPPAPGGEGLAAGIDFRTPHAAFLKTCLDDALQRLLTPNLEREIRAELTDEAELHAVKLAAHNLRSLLMQQPLEGKRVLAIDPGFRTGCKLAALDETGNLLGHLVLFPHGGPGRKKEKRPPKEPPAPTAPPAAPACESAAVPPSMEAPVPTPGIGEATTPTPEMGLVPMPDAPAPDAAVAAPDAAGVPATTPAAESSEAQAAAPEPPPVDKRAEARAKLVDFIKEHQLSVVALGNGTACRETEEVIADIIASTLPELAYAIVPEAGASVYSVSPLAKEELPNLDAMVRTTVSIGRRLQDPLNELVKVDAQSLAAGLFPHEPPRKELKEAIEAAFESCVNQVGVDVNTASAPMLRYVSGLNQLAAREIVEHRKNHGPFTAREQLVDVIGMGPNRYIQSAGFVRVPNAANPLDCTWIHPESYPLVERILTELGASASALGDPSSHEALRDRFNAVNLDELARKLDISVSHLDELLMALARPGRDPRQDMPPPILKKGVLKLDDLQPGMELKGRVLNVVDFGAFVDVGMKDSGLVHISQMANKYIKSPYDVASVNDVVRVWVLKIDKEANHVSLTMIQPGVERKPPERHPSPLPRREERPPQDRRGPPPARMSPPRPAQHEGPRRPPRGRGGPPRHGGPSREVAVPVSLSPRKPRREAPPPTLTQAAIEGKAPLRTLSELAAFYAAKEKKEGPPPAPEVNQAPPAPAPEEIKPPENPTPDAPPTG